LKVTITIQKTTVKIKTTRAQTKTATLHTHISEIKWRRLRHIESSAHARCANDRRRGCSNFVHVKNQMLIQLLKP